MLEVVLTARQLLLADATGTRRRKWIAANGYRANHGGGRSEARNLADDIMGARAEAAALALWAPALRARGLDPLDCWLRFADGDPHDMRGDVAGWEIRGTGYRSGCLPVHPEDDGQPPYLLVIDRCPRFLLPGWIAHGRQGRQPRFWRDDIPHPTYFVPQPELRQPVPLDPLPHPT